MESTQKEIVRSATPEQIAYLQRLAEQDGASSEKSFENLTMDEASKLIDQTLEKQGKTTPQKKQSKPKARDSWAESARFDMAFKLVYKNWVGTGKNIFKHKKAFTKNVQDTFNLINETAEQALNKQAA